MSGEHTVNIFFAGELDGIRVLCNIKAIEIINEAEVLERGLSFGWKLQALANLITQRFCNAFIGNSNSKIIHLLQEEDFGAHERSRINETIVGGALEAELWGVEDSSNVLFPELARFGMAS